MKVGEILPGKYLTKEQVGRGALLTIQGWEKVNLAMEDEPDKWRILIHFQEAVPPLILNATNQGMLIELYTDETDNWIGKQIVAYTEPNVILHRKRVGGIRLRVPVFKTIPPALPAVEPDDDLPF